MKVNKELEALEKRLKNEDWTYMCAYDKQLIMQVIKQTLSDEDNLLLKFDTHMNFLQSKLNAIREIVKKYNKHRAKCNDLDYMCKQQSDGMCLGEILQLLEEE